MWPQTEGKSNLQMVLLAVRTAVTHENNLLPNDVELSKILDTRLLIYSILLWLSGRFRVILNQKFRDGKICARLVSHDERIGNKTDDLSQRITN